MLELPDMFRFSSRIFIVLCKVAGSPIPDLADVAIDVRKHEINAAEGDDDDRQTAWIFRFDHSAFKACNSSVNLRWRAFALVSAVCGCLASKGGSSTCVEVVAGHHRSYRDRISTGLTESVSLVHFLALPLGAFFFFGLPPSLPASRIFSGSRALDSPQPSATQSAFLT